jgi:hypothetical protein
MDAPLSEMSLAYQAGYQRGVDEADMVELNDELKRQYLNGMQPDPPELAPRSPLSGEWAGEAATEVLGDEYTEEEAADYEQGYLVGWEERLLQRSAD